MAYEFDGKKYEKVSAHQKEWGAKLIAELALKGHERVLDLGCGDGELLASLIQEKQVHAQGIEINEQAIYKCVAKGLSVFQQDIGDAQVLHRFQEVFEIHARQNQAVRDAMTLQHIR